MGALGAPALVVGALVTALAVMWATQLGGGGGAPAPADAADTAVGGSSSFARCLEDPADWLHPLPLPSALSAFPAAHNASLLWGSYRPAVYFGLRTRSFPAAVFGLFWHGASLEKMRHQCSEGDGLRRYGWEEHDGRAYGSQRIFDDADDGLGAVLHTSFVKPSELPEGGGDSSSGVGWAARVAVERSPSRSDAAVVYLYYGLDCDGELSAEACAAESQPASATGLSVDKADDGGSVTIAGESVTLGRFGLRISAQGRGNVVPKLSVWGGSGVVLADIQDRVKGLLQKRAKKAKGKKAKASIALPDKVQKGANAVVVRVSCEAGCVIDAVLRQPPAGEDADAAAAVVTQSDQRADLHLLRNRVWLRLAY